MFLNLYIYISLNRYLFVQSYKNCIIVVSQYVSQYLRYCRLSFPSLHMFIGLRWRTYLSFFLRAFLELYRSKNYVPKGVD